MPRFTDNSPGGFFDNTDSSANNANSANRGTGTGNGGAGGPAVDANAADSARAAKADAALSKQYAEDSQGWAVGTDTAALNEWSTTNNSKYWADIAQSHANSWWSCW